MLAVDLGLEGGVVRSRYHCGRFCDSSAIVKEGWSLRQVYNGVVMLMAE